MPKTQDTSNVKGATSRFYRLGKQASAVSVTALVMVLGLSLLAHSETPENEMSVIDLVTN